MDDIENRTRNLYAQFFQQQDWPAFKRTAEYYLETAAKLKKKDINCSDEASKISLRNAQKRLFIGIGCELLLKSFYLKNGYAINKAKHKLPTAPPHLLADYRPEDFREEQTYDINFLVGHLKQVCVFRDRLEISRGLKIARIFRNKEGHIAVYTRELDPRIYSDIELALMDFYRQAFEEDVEIAFAGKKNEETRFYVSEL